MTPFQQLQADINRVYQTSATAEDMGVSVALENCRKAFPPGPVTDAIFAEIKPLMIDAVGGFKTQLQTSGTYVVQSLQQQLQRAQIQALPPVPFQPC